MFIFSRPIAVAILLAPASVAAQDGTLLDEILVTARRDQVQPEIVAGATRTQTRVEDIPQAISVVTRETIEEQQLVRLGDLIANVPNVQIAGTQGNRAEIFNIRGFEVASYAVDGILTNPAQSFTETIRDLGNVAQVEVLKGPASVLYGRGEPGGVINIVTRRPSRESSAELRLQANDFGLRRGEGTATGPVGEALAARISLAAQQTGTFRDLNIEGSRVFFAPAIAWRPGDKTRADFDYEYTYQKSPGDRGLVLVDGEIRGPAERSFGEPWSENFGRLHTVRGRIEQDVGEWLTLRQILSHQSGNSGRLVADFTGISRDGTTLLRRAIRQSQEIRTTTSQTEALMRFDTGPLHHLFLAGFEYVEGSRVTSEQRAPLAPVNIFDPQPGALPGTFVPGRMFDVDVRFLAPYVQDQISIGDDIDILAGLRYDDVRQTTRRNGNEATLSEGRFSPRLGAVWHPAEAVSLYASWSTSFLPRTAVLVDGSAVPPETGRQFEVGAKITPLDGQLIATMALFDIEKNNIATPDPDNIGFSVITGQQRSRGGEIEVSGEVVPGWHLIAGLGYLDAEVTRDNRLPVGAGIRGIPEWSANLWSTYQFKHGALRGLMFGGGLIYRGERPGDRQNSYLVDGFTRYDATVAYTLDDRYRLSLVVRNLTDKFYIEQPISPTTNYPGAPRTVSVSLDTRF